VFVFALANGVTPTLGWLELVPIAVAFVVLATGMSMILSPLYVRFRDVQPIWEVALQVWFYASPIMYAAASYNRFAHGFEKVAMLNPIATLLTQMGHAFIDPEALPSAVTAAGGPLVPIIALALIPITFAFGWWFFTREAPRVAENL